MFYIDAISYLESFWKFGIKLGLDRINHLLYLLDNPHKKYTSIHVAGTNGKGTVCSLVATVLKESGFNVGLYTSPHLLDYTERIKINGIDISKKSFASIIEKIKQVISEKYKLNELPTEFEILTAAAFLYFAEKKVDIAVIETGLGGRLDSTNVIVPIVSAITNVDFDHCKVLGKTLSKIAREKAGIIKKGVPLVTAENKKEPFNVIQAICRRQNSKIIKCGVNKNADVKVVFLKRKLFGQIADIQAGNIKIKNLFVPFSGKHQLLNASGAVGIILEIKKYFAKNGIKGPISKRSIMRGFAKTIWPCRLQIIKKNPLVLLDGAHNPSGIRSLFQELNEIKTGNIIAVFGVMKDKDIKKMADTIVKHTNKVVLVSPKMSRACNSRLLRKYFTKSGLKVAEFDSVLDGFLYAQRIADKNDIICICGSLFTCAEVLKAVRS